MDPMENRATLSLMANNSIRKLHANANGIANTVDQGQHDRSGSGGLLQTLETSLDDIRSLITCRVCVRPLFEPFTIECGHTFCYGCLARWFERDYKKKSCPDCRADVSRAPAPAYIVRDLTQLFANRAELLPVGETTEEHLKWQEEEASLVERDRSSSGAKGGLFRGCFRRSTASRDFPGDYVAREPIRDVEDGVDRCPRCTWELEDGLCQSCGYPSGDDDLSSDAPEHFQSDGFSDEEVGSNYEAMFREMRADFEAQFSDPPVGGLQQTGIPEGVFDPNESQDDTDRSFELEEEEEEDAGSLENFIVEDTEDRSHSLSSPPRSVQWETEDSENEEMQTINSGNDPGSEHGDDLDQDGTSEVSGNNAPYEIEDDSDEGPIPPSRRQCSRGAVVTNAYNSGDDAQPRQSLFNQRSQADDSRDIQTIQQPHPNMARRPRASPTNRRGSANSIIELNSDVDSDAPIPASMHTRRRRPHRRIVSGDESGAEASSGTVMNQPSAPNSHESLPTSLDLSSVWSPTNSILGEHSEDDPHTYPSVNPRIDHTDHRRSPLPSRSQPNSLSPGPSRSPQEQFEQGVRERRARKAERKAERRRLKAERERRRS